MAETMKDLALMVPKPIIPLWGNAATNIPTQQSWTAPPPSTGVQGEPAKWGEKNVIDWYRDQGFGLNDPKALDSLIGQLKTYQSPTNPRGDPNNPFKGKFNVVDYGSTHNGSGPYDGSQYGVTHIEDGMTEQEKNVWRQRWKTPDDADRYKDWPG